MEGLICGVKKHSLAAAAGICRGDRLVAVNGNPVRDILELSFFAADCEVELTVISSDGTKRRVRIAKDPDEDLGLEFESAVFDGIHRCRNNCIFCFVEQMIPGLRKGLYVRDDDYRLSFLYGNFVTLTNLQEEDWERIIATHMSPLYVSVHATNPELRAGMMRNRRAGDILERIRRLTAAGIEVHTQIVCCPGYNDGSELVRTYEDLRALTPGVATMAVVPVGLTKNRARLTRLHNFTRGEASRLVEQATLWQEENRRELGKSFIYLSDEFYVLAGASLPPEEWYDGFPQLENGIGLSRHFLAEWQRSLELRRAPRTGGWRCVIPCGESAFRLLAPAIEAFNAEHGTRHELRAVANDFFGRTVNVTGLLTAQDLLAQLPQNLPLALPADCLNTDNLFLDGMTLECFRSKWGREVRIIPGAAELYNFLTQM